VDNSLSPPLGSLYCDQQFSPQGCQQWGGGGITNATNGRAKLTEVTVARNSSEDHGGGSENLGDMRTNQVTIAENKAPVGKGGGLYTERGTGVTIPSHTLVAQNTGR
jgi:hypothetical protein